MNHSHNLNIEWNEKCSEHDTELKYYCSSCDIPICSDWAMFGDSHKGHKFEKINKIYQLHLDKISGEKEVLDDKLGEMTSKMNNIDKHISTTKRAKDERIRELGKFVENVQKKLESQMEEKMDYLEGKKKEVKGDIGILEECHLLVTNQIDTLSKPELINKSETMVNHIRNISNQVYSQNSSLAPVKVGFTSEILPEYKYGEFIVKNYTDIREDKEIIYSEPLVTSGVSWRLKVYPNGNGQARGNYLSVFLERVKGYSSPAE